MNINIVGFNIFSKGGTSRSNINLIKAFLNKGHTVNYFNYNNFEINQITKLIIHEDIDYANFRVFQLNNPKALADGDILIITREDLFKYARSVKEEKNNIKIVGEIHGPLEYINDDIDLCLDTIDSIRVSTPSIKEKFQKKYKFKSVFNQYVNAEHVDICDKPINTKRNFLIKSRFEDGVKDISYIIKLMNYIVNNRNYEDIHLYIIGYGPSENLYKNLVRYYNLDHNVFINEKEPLNYIYISTSHYETLGYSILETIMLGNRALIYPGRDDVLKEIYSKYHCIEFLQKDIVEDSKKLLTLLNHKYTSEDRIKDVTYLTNEFKNDSYIDEYISKIAEHENQQTFLTTNKEIKYNIDQSDTKLNKLNSKRDLYEKLKKNKMLKHLLTNNYFFKKMKSFYNYRKNKLQVKVLDKIEPEETKVFIESFHGNNFSGDPKYIALKIKELYKEKKIFVSSINSLVDIEIRNHGFIPVRFGTDQYVKSFRRCKYVFMNGNSWDKVYKHDKQVFIQTWHGFPLKKMVNDLENNQDKELQLKQFLPRMNKWDYLFTSSDINKLLLKSAFKLEENNHLNILTLGAPRNEYLLEHNNDFEKTRILNKYMIKDFENKTIILYCPTWRNDERESLTNMDLRLLLDYLPKDYEIIVKLHPNESKLRNKYNNLSSRIHCFYNEFIDIQELYIIADAMITDYSSTIFDYAHLSKPIFLLQEDDKNYQNDVGFYFDIFELGDFPEVPSDERQLANQLKNIKNIQYSKLINRLMTKDKHDTSKKILKEVFS
ncbi:CDP-glycerol glycerophosphotransferase family protein [Staphylococcus equorum]|uniref:CDP-glycerol glycerophosphotransferase family protein n=1 Tax=Staphylococcus equorum TaxID=246432 RepID=UPI000853D6A6|nr:CDP-glycerol glycerophosphotransferase family protein [Staphylococcus equorum]OEL09277.1 glycosyl transferase family 1 [Staphylococcus equorum]